MQQWAHGGLETVISRQGVAGLKQARRQPSHGESWCTGGITNLRWRQNSRTREGLLHLGLQGAQQEIGIRRGINRLDLEMRVTPVGSARDKTEGGFSVLHTPDLKGS